MQNQPRKKSPRAPSVSLEDALERVFRVYDLERLHAAPVDAVAQALGFKNASSGSALSYVAALRYFGLLERPKDGFLAVSKAVETYKYAPDEAMKGPILLEFLKTPPLYQELLTKYPAGLPSTATLKYELIQKGFLPQAVEAVLSAFLQSVAFAKYFDLQSPDIQPDKFSPLMAKELPSDTRENIRQPLPQNNSEAQLQFTPSLAGDMDQIPIRLAGGRKAWLAIPAPFYESDKIRIKAQIDVLFADTDEGS
jgi:hypothetical protein